MPFITREDFDASVHDDILNALTKGNDIVITDNIDRAIDEMKAYLNGRYDTVNIFNKAGADRNKFLLHIGVTIARYYIYQAHNPRKLTQITVETYEKAIEDLEKIQSGKLNPEGLPTPPETTDANSGNGFAMQWGSDNNLGTSW